MVGKSENNLDEKEDNLLSRMLVGKFACRDQLGALTRKSLKDEEIVAHVHSLVGGGIGTLNAIISFIIHTLAMHPRAQQKAYDEVMQYCGMQV